MLLHDICTYNIIFLKKLYANIICDPGLMLHWHIFGNIFNADFQIVVFFGRLYATSHIDIH